MNVLNAVCGANPLDPNAPQCPICKKPGKRVKPQTVKNLLNMDILSISLEGYSLCLSKDCDVVYFGQQIFYKDDVRKKVWFKENNPSVPVCYCKNVSEEDIIEHITVRGCCSSIKDIQDHTGANTGKECLTENPAGT